MTLLDNGNEIVIQALVPRIVRELLSIDIVEGVAHLSDQKGEFLDLGIAYNQASVLD